MKLIIIHVCNNNFPDNPPKNHKYDIEKLYHIISYIHNNIKRSILVLVVLNWTPLESKIYFKINTIIFCKLYVNRFYFSKAYELRNKTTHLIILE
jgi:hypothetical protein